MLSLPPTLVSCGGASEKVVNALDYQALRLVQARRPLALGFALPSVGGVAEAALAESQLLWADSPEDYAEVLRVCHMIAPRFSMCTRRDSLAPICQKVFIHPVQACGLERTEYRRTCLLCRCSITRWSLSLRMRKFGASVGPSICQ